MQEESERSSSSSSSCSSLPNLLRRIGMGGILRSLALVEGDDGIAVAEWSLAGLCEEYGGGGLDDMEADEFGILHGIVSVRVWCE